MPGSGWVEPGRFSWREAQDLGWSYSDADRMYRNINGATISAEMMAQFQGDVRELMTSLARGPADVRPAPDRTKHVINHWLKFAKAVA